jgi:POT family proton-dependent oligopeptide transporter
MTTGDAMDNVVAARHDPALALPPDEKHELPPSAHATEQPRVLGGGGTGIRVAGNYLDADKDGHIGQEGDEWPTEEDFATLRKVPDRISWAAYTVAFIELCERFSYYGTQVICMLSRQSISGKFGGF